MLTKVSPDTLKMDISPLNMPSIMVHVSKMSKKQSHYVKESGKKRIGYAPLSRSTANGNALGGDAERGSFT